jgi:hypothetical protein
MRSNILTTTESATNQEYGYTTEKEAFSAEEVAELPVERTEGCRCDQIRRTDPGVSTIARKCTSHKNRCERPSTVLRQLEYTTEAHTLWPLDLG